MKNNILFNKENLFVIFLFFFSLLINQYYGNRGIFPADSFAHFDTGFRILLGEYPFKNYWVVSGPFIDYLQAVFEAGRRYGMELHYNKFQLLNIQCDTRIQRPDGLAVNASARMVYLGTVLSEHGSTDAELNRRIGQAKSDFRVLSRIWNHSTLS